MNQKDIKNVLNVGDYVRTWVDSHEGKDAGYYIARVAELHGTSVDIDENRRLMFCQDASCKKRTLGKPYTPNFVWDHELIEIIPTEQADVIFKLHGQCSNKEYIEWLEKENMVEEERAISTSQI